MRNPKFYNQFKKDQCLVGIDCLGPLDVDHVRTLGAGGLDTESNLMTLCRKHHVEKGMKGIDHMANKYENYLIWLRDYGWQKDFRGKWVRYES